ncbi:MAG: CVNH domain-containing protein [Waterburya sp.]
MKLKTLVSSVTVICFSLFLALGFFSAPAAALGDFSQTCQDSTINGSTLSATCQRADGSYGGGTSIDLNTDIENVDGRLTWQPSNFIETCRKTKLVNGNTMDAECKTRDQRWVSTRINLDDHIANINGVLTYE